MTKPNYFILPNGVKVIYYNDKNVHSFFGSVIVKFGSINTQIINEHQKIINIHPGIAHLLEHILMEYSPYGNIINEIQKDCVYSNALTSLKITRYYFTTVHDFAKYLEMFITLVNKPIFTKEDLEEAKHAIINELNMTNDNKFKHLRQITNNCLFKKMILDNPIGTLEDIKSITYEEAMMTYDAFYKPENQIVAIYGNLKISKIRKMLINLYASFRSSSNKYYLPLIDEPKEINKFTDYYECLTDNYVNIAYKINIAYLSSYDKVKLTFYINFFLNENFKSESNIYKEILKKKISNYDINYNIDYVDKFMIINLGLYTNKESEYLDLVQSQLNNKSFTLKDFKINQKKTIVDIILRKDTEAFIFNAFLDNILTFNYYENDKVEDIENMTFNDYQKVINNLDFSNYVITYLKKKEVK
jgi:predicted Zn-dependent peptidase